MSGPKAFELVAITFLLYCKQHPPLGYEINIMFAKKMSEIMFPLPFSWDQKLWQDSKLKNQSNVVFILLSL